jgi:hypothetical protein
MAMLISNSFPDSSEGKAMLVKVKRAFTRLTWTTAKDEGGYYAYFTAPTKLKKDRDSLKDDYEIIWIECTLEFDEGEAGASIFVSRREIKIGPFFLASRFTTTDMEKIILHEYLHAALAVDRQYHHSFMEQIIKYNLGYPGPWNPGEGVQ